jgi:hypothetical protein
MPLSPPPAPGTTRSAPRLGPGPPWLLYACTCLIVAVLAGAFAASALNLRETTLRNTEQNLRNVSLTLAEQADRAVQGLDLVLSNLNEYLVTAGVGDSASYRQKMAGEPVHQMLREKLIGLPYINAITMISAQGDLINFSRSWPIPPVNVADRDYFRALQANPAPERFLSMPVANRGNGTWTFYLARGVHGRDGQLAGLLLGAIELKYFEDFYRTVSLGAGTAISLMRADGTQLVRYPPGDTVGKFFPMGGPRALQGGVAGVIRDISPVDGTLRIKAAQKLTNFPLIVLVTETEDAALTEWRHVVWVLGLVTAGCAAAILIAALAVGRWWRQQHALGQARAEHAEAEKARALAEASLLRERERNAEEANRAKSGFLAMMSHEIRTPMNAVLGLAGTLLDGSLAAPQRKAVEAIRDSGDNLLRIINDILDFSKLDAGRMTFELAAFSPATLTQNAVSILGPRAAAKGLAINADSDPALPAGLLGDAGRIRQVLLNLVSNAVKFTEAGSVAIHAGLAACQDGAATVEWTVRDTGIGIPPDQIGNLFGEFVQADSSISRRFGGSGLGLAISRRVVEQMGGTIGVTSELGVGTTFRVRITLPVAEAPPAAPASRADTAEAVAVWLAALGRPLRVLFAEDNPTNQFVALQLLKGFDIQVDVVGDGLEAVQAATSFSYDVVCMDMRMPEMDGLTATRLIRKRGGVLATVPIIALTANAFPEDVRACFEAGMNEFVPKPVSKEVLLGAILRVLTDLAPAALFAAHSAAGSPDAAPPAALPPPALALPALPPAALPPPALRYAGPPAAAGRIAEPPAAAAVSGEAEPATPVLDQTAMAELLENLGLDGAAELLAVFTADTRARLRRLAAGVTPLTALLREIHTLKGAAGTVCAARLARQAALLEPLVRDRGHLEPAELAALTEAFEAYLQRSKARALDCVPVG